MGTKVSTLSRKKKRANTSSTKSKKSYNFHDSHSIFSHFTSSTSPTTVHDEKELTEEHHSSIPSITDSMFTSGRTFHHVQNSAYWLPNDDEEMDRLTGVRSHLKIEKKNIEKKTHHRHSI
jgi:hypothetical protein